MSGRRKECEMMYGFVRSGFLKEGLVICQMSQMRALDRRMPSNARISYTGGYLHNIAHMIVLRQSSL